MWYVQRELTFILSNNESGMRPDAKLKRTVNDQEWGDKLEVKPKGFEWEAPGVGRITLTRTLLILTLPLRVTTSKPT